MPIDEVLTEEVVSQQQTPAVAEGPLQYITATCKLCEVTFFFTKGEKRFFGTVPQKKKKMGTR